MADLVKDDYVLATKWSDGDPQDQWCVGFFVGMLPKVNGDRYEVARANGALFRGNGFRRVEKITEEQGLFLLEHHQQIQNDTQSLWEWLDQAI